MLEQFFFLAVEKALEIGTVGIEDENGQRDGNSKVDWKFRLTAESKKNNQGKSASGN